MSQPLPHSDFRWEEIEAYEFSLKDSSRGYVYEVDIEYPNNLWSAHSDFPLAPHHINITYYMLCDYSKELVKPNYKSHKLCQTFLDKNSYIIHKTNLVQYLEMGLKIK